MDMLFFKAKLSDGLRHISCGKLVAKNEFTHPDRTVDSYLIMVGIKNVLHLKENNDILDLKKNEALFLRPYLHQCSYLRSSDLSYYWSHFYLGKNIEVLDFDQAVETYYLMSKHVHIEGDNTILIPRLSTLMFPNRIILLFQQLFYSRYGNCYSLQYADNCLSMLLIELTQQAMEYYHLEYENSNGFRFSEIVQWINMNVQKPLAVSEIAEQFGYTPNYLSNLFKSKTGYPLIKYINRLKMEQAKDMLLNSSASVRDIANDVGFVDTKYFMRTFKQYIGVTPTRLKNAWSDLHMNCK